MLSAVMAAISHNYIHLLWRLFRDPLVPKKHNEASPAIYEKDQEDDASTGTASTTPFSISSAPVLTSNKRKTCATQGVFKDDGETNIETVAKWNLEGNTHFRCGEFKLAETCYHRAIESYKLGSHDQDLDMLPVLADTYSNLATVYCMKEGKFVSSRAMNLLLLSLQFHQQYRAIVQTPSFQESALVLKHDKFQSRYQTVAMAAVLSQLGMGWASRGLYKEAQAALLHGYDLRLEAFENEPHKLIAQSLEALGNLAMDRRDFKSAIHYYEVCFSVHSSLEEEDDAVSESLIESLQRLASAYQAAGESAAALFGYKAVLSMQKELLQMSSCCQGKWNLRNYIGQTLARIADLLYRNERYREAIESYQQSQYFYLTAGLAFYKSLLLKTRLSLEETSAVD